jgi:nicotinamidase-related amidase
MKALIVIDAQNEFSAQGKRPVTGIDTALQVISERVKQARDNGTPIAWVRHFNKPEESPAFRPGTWGFEFLPGLGPIAGSDSEIEFHKNVFGAFTGSDLGIWLKKKEADEILLTGFYTHGCVSTTAREALMAGLSVHIDPNGTATCDMENEVLGNQTADEIRRSALLQLVNMGAVLDQLNR